ncbi:efflux RND transporter periplasmic adaptor subunit [Nannocystis radixulma]|uniref:Efflux RND transporter periplasmic adaptor subunit n=1 Tax=Nannocystis radixulma TaxID=2995305 RepID=A0ABT5B6U5_9BACT|nr:efflux RND transporter periplasmic adaptor subunit [Nannocystis radixulma]MDC0669845.1 efflux RND transporter periplasmic adaptor subunit [Nannocystis radixulma]
MLARRVLFLVLLTLAACGSPGAAAPKSAPGPVEVTVMTVVPTPVTLTRELPGRVSARRVAEVRARVSGIVEQRLFVEGSDVKEGQPLYRIESAPYMATLQSARANLQRAQSGLATSRDIAQRDEDLLSNSGAVSVETAERSAATLRSVEADIAAGRAAVKSAKINLDYTTVTAPVSGRIGRSLVTEGAYVQQSPATLMATIQQIDTVYVDVTQSTTELQRLRRELESDKLRPPGATTVELLLEDGSVYAEKGSLEFTDVTVETGTGSVLLRAVFPNPRGELLPGMFVRARIDQGQDPQAILVPQRAVTRDTRGQAWALVVGADNKVERRKLVADRVVGDAWRVTSGLVSGEQVILDGVQKARPGAEVTTVPAAPEELPKGTAAGSETKPETKPSADAPASNSGAAAAIPASAGTETKSAAEVTGSPAASNTAAGAARQ